MTRKRHWRKFNFNEWRADALLAQVSRAARSLWLDLCGLIYEADDNGRLTLRGQAYDSSQLSAILGDDPRTITALMKELGRAGVYSVDPDGTPFCRRIRREMLKENIGDIDPDVGAEVSNLSKRKKSKNKGVENHSLKPEPEPEIEPLQGSILVPGSNVVALRPRAVGRGTSEPLRPPSPSPDVAAMRIEFEDLGRVLEKYPETRTAEKTARLERLRRDLASASPAPDPLPADQPPIATPA